MKLLISAALLVGSAVLFTSCEKITGDGPVVTEDRDAKNFNSLVVSIPGQVIYSQDNDYKVEIEAQQNIIDVIETRVSGGELLIKIKNNVRVGEHEDIIVYVSSPEINGLKLSGSGNLKSNGNVQSQNMKLELSGSGNIMVPHLATGDLEGVISGSGDILVSAGSATDEDLKISGSGSIDLVRVAAKAANTTTSGSGTMRVNVSDKLDVSISGSGNVYYKGNPSISTSISGSGKVKPM